MMSSLERGAFVKLYNRGGYVLDFSTADFDAFTLGSVGIALCERYQMSKGKSLIAFVDEGDPRLVEKLLLDLFEYYETYYRPEFDPECAEDFRSFMHDKGNRSLYLKCAEFANRTKLQESHLNASADYLKSAFSSQYMNSQIDLLMKMRLENPTEAIGKSKELLESCCKTILMEQGIEIDKSWDTPKLVKETMNLLDVRKENVSNAKPEGATVNKILSSLNNLATGVAEFRNQWGSGHGKAASYEPLFVRHAKLAVGSSLTLVEYLWDTYLWRKEQGLFAKT